MILWISKSGEALPIAYRMRKEGTDCQIYVHLSEYKKNYDGIIQKVKIAELKQAIRKSSMIIFDGAKANEKEKEDIALLKMFGIKTSNQNVFGAIADKLMKTHKVIGSSDYTESIEFDRMAGVQLAAKIGISIPETHEFKGFKKGIDFLKENEGLWVFKPFNNKDLDLTYVENFKGEIVHKMNHEYKNRVDEDSIEYILQKKIDGVALSTEGWFDGEKFIHFNHTLEDKKFMNSDLGPNIGSQSNTVWIKRNDGILVSEIKKLAPYLSGYVGPIDINCIIKNGTPYFLEFTPRLGWDAFYCLLTLSKNSITEFFENNFNVGFYDGYSASARLSIPPYPYASKNLLRDMAKDVNISSVPRSFWMQDVYFNNGFMCAGADGILGVVAERGNSIGGAWGNVYRTIKSIKIGSYLQIRTDGTKTAERKINKLKGLNIA